jgi:hypothetical protein
MAVMAKDSAGVNSLFTLFLFFYANDGFAWFFTCFFMARRGGF